MDDHDHDHDPSTDDSFDRLPPNDALESQDPILAASTVTDSVSRGTVAIVGGVFLLVSAVQSLLDRQLRAIPKAVAGGGLLAYGLERRTRERESIERPATFEPNTEDVEGSADGRAISDRAHAVRGREEHGDTAGTGTDVSSGEAADTGTEFGDEEDVGDHRSKPDTTETDDPRQGTNEGTDIDLSDAAMADEASEAVGPDPEQAQPSQTDSIEPDETPAEDAAHMKVEPGEDDEDDAETDE